MSLLAAYQKDPASPSATGALLSAMRPMLTFFAKTRAPYLGGYRDAEQDAIAALLTVAQKYVLSQSEDVATNVLGLMADQLRTKVRKGYARVTNEVATGETPEQETFGADPSDAIELALLVKRGHLQPNDPPVLLLDDLGLTRAQMAAILGLKERVVKERLAAARKRLNKFSKK